MKKWKLLPEKKKAAWFTAAFAGWTSLGNREP